MLDRIQLKNFGPISDLDWSDLGRINLIIGTNSCGKTFLLKAIYCTLRTLEEYKRGNEQRSASEILADKLHWTFQTDRIGELVTKGASSPLISTATLDGHTFSYSFGKDTQRQISTLENHISPRESNSIFLPAKEVLSLHPVILKSREQDRVFGFDDTYFDLAKALRVPTQRGRNYKYFAFCRQKLNELLGGSIEYDEASNRWTFVRKRQRFPIGITAEGIKKIAILDTLLGNRYLDTHSIILIDEPESALHPDAISKLLDIIAILAESGIQFFLASHSYFVIKKLFLIALKHQWSIPVISSHESHWQRDDLLKGMPDNPIIDASIRLYEQEMEHVLA